jgi:hypothetical protein
MDGKEFTEDLTRRHYAELEGQVIAVRKALAELDTSTPQFVELMQRQAKREVTHGIAFTKALLIYSELEPHERADVAEQAAEEYRHFALIKDYLIGRGSDVEEVSADAYNAYFDRFLSGNIKVFRLCNIAEKSAVAFIAHLRDASKDSKVRKLAEDIIADEEEHEDWMAIKMARISEDESERQFLEEQFVESWTSQKTGVFLEARELGVDVDRVVAAFKESIGAQ